VIQQNPASKTDITEGRPMKGIAFALRSMKSEMIVVIKKIKIFYKKVLTYKVLRYRMYLD
jgi:hypothetical protein